MARLTIDLLGSMQARLDGQPVTSFAYDKVRALLAYLAIEADRPHRREALAGLLWPDQPERAARHGLSQALATLRQAIGDHAADPPFLLIARETIQFNPAGDYALDVATFTRLLAACNFHTHRRAGTCRPCARRREQALALYRGDFLVQFSLSDSPGFEEWALIQRERLLLLAQDALARLSAYYEQRGAYEQARRLAARWIELDPWREEAHRRLMRALHMTGQRAEALAQYERCRRRLDDELGIAPEEATTDLYEQIRVSEPGRQGVTTPDPRSGPLVSTRRHNLPAQATSFVGREEELAALEELLADPGCRLITILGPGGMGKTRLALQAASEAAETFAHGVVYVPLAALGSAEFLVPAIMAALGQPLQSQRDPKEQLFACLREQDLLLLLDNVEHVLAGAELVSELLQRAPGLTVLATSRERLALHGEWLFDLEGLSCPAEDAQDGIERYSAARLFAQRARQVRRRFSLAAGDVRAVARICRMVEGLPLAIELAAATLREATCAEIAQAIETNLQALATPARDVPDRHRSMEATFEHSWRLLTHDQQRALRRLAVFRGGFEEEAAGCIAGASVETLAALLDKSLLRRNAAGRFDMHELLRQYAAQKLRAAGEEEQTRSAHLAYFTQLGEAAEPHLTGGQQAAWLARLDAENDNMRAALEWSLQTDEGGRRKDSRRMRAEGARRKAQGLQKAEDEQSNESAPLHPSSFILHPSRLAGALARFWGIRGYLSEGRAWLEAALAHTAAHPASPSAARAKALKGAGVLAWSQGDYAQATEHFEASLALFEALGDRDGIASLHNNLGVIALHQGDYARAQTLLEASLALRREQGDHWGIAVCLNNLGAIAGKQGDAAGAQRFYEESLALHRELGNTVMVATLLSNLGDVAILRGELARARGLYAESLGLRRELGDKVGLAASLARLGDVALRQGDRPQARALFAESLALLRELGDKERIAERLEGFAALAADEGNPCRAARLWGAAESLREAIGVPLPTGERADYEQQVVATRALLSPAAFAAAWAGGRATPIEEAIAEALEERQRP